MFDIENAHATPPHLDVFVRLGCSVEMLCSLQFFAIGLNICSQSVDPMHPHHYLSVSGVDKQCTALNPNKVYRYVTIPAFTAINIPKVPQKGLKRWFGGASGPISPHFLTS